MQKPYSIHLVACSPELSPMAYPLGALCIQTALTTSTQLEGQIEVALSHYIADTHAPKEAAQAIADVHPHILGISLYLYNRSWFDEFIQHFSLLSPQTILFAGGPEAGAHSNQLLARDFDFLLVGEGEESVCSAIEQILAGNTPTGSGIRTLEEPYTQPAYPEHLETLESPILSGIAQPSKYMGVLWEMTRGCPYHCAFCFESRGNRSVRTYPEERIVHELNLLIEHEVKHVFVLDPTFNLQRERTIEMLTLIRDRAPSDMHFTFEVRAELIDEVTAELFGSFHCSLQIGLQSSNPDILRTIGRNFNPQNFAQKIALLNRHGVVFGLDLIIGLPGDTEETFRKSLDYAVSCRPSNIDIFLLAVLPGTQLACDADTLHLMYQQESPYLLEQSPTMSPNTREKLIQLQSMCDRLYTEGRAVMWFHVACSALEKRPVEIFDSFGAYVKQYPQIENEDIFSVQDRFIRHQFTNEGKSHLLPAMLSYMELHQGISYLQDTGESPVVTLSYTPDELTRIDTVSIQDFVRNHTASNPQTHVIYIEEGTLYVEPLD